MPKKQDKKGKNRKSYDGDIEMDSLDSPPPTTPKSASPAAVLTNGDDAQASLIQGDEMDVEVSIFNEGNIKIVEEKIAENEQKLTMGCSLKDINDKYGVGVSLYFDSIKCLICMNVIIFIPCK